MIDRYIDPPDDEMEDTEDWLGVIDEDDVDDFVPFFSPDIKFLNNKTSERFI